MSTGKRLAKRSILGTRVCAPGEDGLYYAGIIQAVKTASTEDAATASTVTSSLEESTASGNCIENSNGDNKYSVKFDLSRKVKEFAEADLVGPGFSNLTAISKLRPGQIVYVTYSNREMQGSVVCHRPQIDQVIIRLLVS